MSADPSLVASMPQLAGRAKDSGFRRLVQPEWVFLLLAVGFGSVSLFLTPPLQVPDEGPHFFRAFQLAEGRIRAVKQGEVSGDYLPQSFERIDEVFLPLGMHPERKTSRAEVLAATQVRIDGSDRRFTEFSNTAIYPPLPYLPQALGIAVVRWFSASVLTSYYAGRLFNLLTSAALMCLAIRRTPVGKWAFLTLALTPMSLFVMASLSSDALTNSVSFLFIAHVLWCACGHEGRLPAKSLLLLVLLGLALGMMKPGYAPLIFSYFLIPPAKLGSRRNYAVLFLVILSAALMASGGWALAVRDIYSPAVPGKIDPREQLRFVLSHPGDFFWTVLRTSTTDAPGTLREYIGILGVLDTPLPAWAIVLNCLLLGAASLAAFSPPGALTTRQALIALLTALATYLFILVAIHLTWDKVGPTESIDVQGRYFVPLGPLVALGFSRVGRLLPPVAALVHKLIPVLASAAIPCILAVMLAALHQRYFVDDQASVAEREFDEGQKSLKEGNEARGLKHFREAIRLNPEHDQAHFNLGVLLARERPLEAIEHYRTASRLAPDDFQVHNNLANVLARQGIFDDAIRHYREALRIAPNDEAAQRNLQHAMRSRDALERSLARIASAIQSRARDGMVEKRRANTDEEGFYLKPNRGQIQTPEGSPLFPKVKYLWRCLPPSGDPIRLFDRHGQPVRQPRRAPFYACAAYLIGPRRVFVFPPPVDVILLPDEEVSWFYQVRMNELTEEERAREKVYRAREGLHFPLPLQPEQSPKKE